MDHFDIDQINRLILSKHHLSADSKIDNILKGKERKFYEENCLVKQVYVRAENKETVEKFAADTKVVSFKRVKVGEGIEKEETFNS